MSSSLLNRLMRRKKCDHALRFKHKIRIEIFVIISPGAVGLNAERIEIEFVGLALIVKGVEQDANVIVIKNVISLGNVGSHFVGFVVTMKRDVEKLRIVAEHHLSWFGRRDVVAGLNLIEIF